LLTIPTDPEFSSLNLAMAVQVLTYELLLARHDEQIAQPAREAAPATGQEMEHFYRHLEAVMIASGFLDTENPRHLMRRLRRLFIKARPDKNEINILRGFLASVDPARSASAGK
jgi:tRNA/rRNA methyltransferase/tRNA (cytidine32/uridine32-2'-O)-methyltransferase